MIVEGTNCARELIRAGYPVEKVIMTKENNSEVLDLCKSKRIPFEIVEKGEIEKISKSKNSQGVISFVKKYEYYDLDGVLNQVEAEGRLPFVVVLDSIVDPHNVGAIIRSAECLGADVVVIPQNRACEVNETVFKTSAGAIGFVKVASVVNLSQTIEKLKKRNIWCYALEAGNDMLGKTDLSSAIALVVGSEGKGVSRLVRKTCDGTISIPMIGKINSLNASNAAAIAMYEVARQRNK